MAMADIKAGGAYVELLLRDKAFLARLKAAGQKLKNFGSEISGFGKQLMGISATLMAPVAAAGMVFANFDDKMREVKAIVGATGDEFTKLTLKAKQLGASTSFTAVEVGALMAELGRAGFDASQVEAMTGAVLDLARATSTDAALSASVLAATMKQFGLEAAESARVADVLTQAANASATSVEGLGESLSYVGPDAANLGMTIEETIAILGALGDIGIQGSSSGTALRRMLTTSAAEAKKLNEIFGVSFHDAAGNVRPLVDTLAEVHEATKNLSSGERMAKFNEAFGLLGITGASAIAKSSQSVRNLHDQLVNASGAAKRLFQKWNNLRISDRLRGSLRRLALASSMLRMRNALSPPHQTSTKNLKLPKSR